jgi:hypothetical protein
MALFVALHQHQADRCPAADPQMGSMLLQHLSSENASGQGVTIQAEAVVNDAHTLYLIVEADSRDRVEGFMAPFAQAGTVEVLPASSCEAVIGRGGAAQARRRRLAGHCVLRSPAAWRCRSACRPLTPGHDTRELKRVRSSRAAASMARTDWSAAIGHAPRRPSPERDRCGQNVLIARPSVHELSRSRVVHADQPDLYGRRSF